MKFSITKEFTFSASHILLGLAAGHQCGRLHGHNYTVTLELTGPLNEDGMVMDYGDLSDFDEWVKDTLDHRHLNDGMVSNPTAENLAHYIMSNAPLDDLVVAVTVCETPKTTARCEL